MAYTIISQNNTTTTLQDENGNIIYVPGRVTLATSTDYTITEVNNNTATLTDGSGKVIRDVPCVVVLAGGGSSDTHNKGYYATPEALAEAEPTAEAGDWAIVGSTDTVWVWDSDTTAWVDSDQKGQVTSVNNKTGAVTITGADVLPTQTGNSGKFLTTDGTDASWATINALQNTATGTGSITVAGTATASDQATNVGVSSTANQNGGTAYGYNSHANGSWQCTAIGPHSSARGGYSVALGAHAETTGANSIQINADSGARTNSDANTFKVGNANGNYEIMSADGTIPHARLTNAVQSASVTIATTDWSSNTASVTVSGLTATSVVWVAPDNASQSAYTTAGVHASSQSADTLVFSCTQTPASSLTINVVWC